MWVSVLISTIRPMPSCVPRVHIRVSCVNLIHWIYQRSIVYLANWTRPSTFIKINASNLVNAPTPPTHTLTPLPATNHANSVWVTVINAKTMGLHVLTVWLIIIFITRHVSVNRTVLRGLWELLLINQQTRDCVLYVIQHVDHASKPLISAHHA